jgi:2-polyprenyl-6-hydroxyphenyl methylase/3-demethylubiquinone-9 3-methyltransferase
MTTSSPEIQALKEEHRKTWALGDYSRIDELTREIGRTIVERAGVSAGSDVLDVGAGSGNAAIPAARRGARVIASDLQPKLFIAGRKRAHEAGVEIEWIEADAEELPFEDERFDYVLSSIGVDFAPRHEVVAAELFRVCRPGGTIALANWVTSGYGGGFLRVVGPYMPPPYGWPPTAWGDEEHVRRLFAEYPVELTFEPHSFDFIERSSEAIVDRMADYYGPLMYAKNMLSAEGRWEGLRDELIAMGDELNTDRDGAFRAPGDYLIVLARKPR